MTRYRNVSISMIVAAISLMMVSTKLSAQQVFYLWENGTPGFEHLKNTPEKAKDWWVKSVHNPSITAYFPEPSKATGAAILVFPGGGHSALVFNSEGADAAPILNEIGVAVFVLKYRLAREEGSPYSLPEHATQDAQRAMRLIRNRAEEWNLDADKIGVMGFSAGGEVAAFIAYEKGLGDPAAVDVLERQHTQPDFQILVYPGPLGIPETLPEDAPPAFMVAAIDDPCCVKPILDLINQYQAAGIPAELHVYARGGHAFNLGQWTEIKSLSTWTDRLVDWLKESEIAVPGN